MSKPIQGKRLEEKIVQYLPKDKYVMIEYEDMEKKLYQNLWKSVADEIEKEYKFKKLDIPTAVEAAEGDKDTLVFLFSSFRDNEEKTRKDLTESFDQEDYPNYTVFVHALKSTSKMVGAIELSDKAKKLEEAGKDGKIDYIKKNHKGLMKTYDDVIQEVKDYLSQKEQ